MTAAFLDWLSGWVKATPTHFGVFCATTLAAYGCLLAVAGWAVWRFVRPWLYCTLAPLADRLRWWSSTRVRAHVWDAPLPDPVVGDCWAEDEPLPIDTTDAGRALVDAYGQASAQAEARAELGLGWATPSRAEVDAFGAAWWDPAAVEALDGIAEVEAFLAEQYPDGAS